DSYALVMEDLARIFGNGGSAKELQGLVETTRHADEKSGWRFAAMVGLMEGLVSRNIEQSPHEFLNYVYGGVVAGNVKIVWEHITGEVIAAAGSMTVDEESRITAMDLMGFIGSTEHLPVFAKALQPEHPRGVQLAVVRAIGRQNDREGAELLMNEQR